ncbi:SRPBCC family protein [Kribbella sp.]|uniref:SRPBCC family protein n=1 Tax=Kribbella sp. TaxID=1871183 RepID=UPI002D2D0281|nr:SRPBCC family protein [Kribbella sp.]HZX05782.1 SRPBCC family protein [Kribbella sp.]
MESLLEELPVGRLKDELQDAFTAVAERVIDLTADKVDDLAERLGDVAAGGSFGGGGGGLKGSMIGGALKSGVEGVKDKIVGSGNGSGNASGGGSSKAVKATNIIEQIDVGVPIDVAYDLWTQFQDFPDFMKKVESVEQESPEKLNWRAKIVWSHRSWEATILEQVPDDRIVWRSKGQKGHVDGCVTFHDLAPNLTRILLVLEYYPQGLFERVGNIWRAQGRRARLELKHFRRHVMTRTILDPDSLEGWRGEIRDSEVVRDHGEPEPDADETDDAEYDETDEAEDQDEDDEADDRYADDEGDEGDEEPADDQYDDEAEDEDEDEDADEDSDEYDDWDADEDYDDGAEDEDSDDYDDAQYDDRPSRRAS